MKTSLLIAAVIFALSVFTGTPSKAGSQTFFALPQTAAEKALDRLFKVSLDDKNDFSRFFYKEWEYDPLTTKTYLDLVTTPLWKAVSKREKELVNDHCDGHYKSGEICGIGYNVVICGQDHPDTFLFHTVSAAGNISIISYSGTTEPYKDKSHIPLYKMIKTAEGWKLDGISCGKGQTFNME